VTTAFKAVKDRAFSTVAAGLNNVTDPVAFTVAAGEGTRFPDPAADGEFKVTIGTEIVLCTVRAVDTLTVSRGQDGTTPAVHANGSGVELRVIASLFDDLYTAINAVEAGFVKMPGTLANALLRMSGVYVDGDEFTIGTDIFRIDPIATDSTDDTGGGLWNNVTDPLTVAMAAAQYPVIGVGGTGPLKLGELVYINTEYLRVTVIAGNNVTFRRGAGGSAIGAHANGVHIMVSAARPITHIPIGVQADFSIATVTPIFASSINEPAGAAGQSADVTAMSLEAGVVMLVVAEIAGIMVLATTQVSTNGLWDNAIMRRGAAAVMKQVYRTTVVPDTEEVTAEKIYIPLPFAPSTVLVRVLVTADGKELETAAANAVQKWDGATQIIAAAAPAPDYVLLTAGTTVKWTGAHSLHILALE